MTRIKIGIVAVILLMSNLGFAQTIQDGRKFLYYERYNSAKDALEKAAEAAPANPEVIYWLGQAWLELKQPAKAKEVYSKALANPTLGSNPLLLVGMGQVEILESKVNEARQRFETAISLTKGKDIYVLNAIGRANLEKGGDPDYGIAKLEQATTIKNFKEAEVYVNMGNLYRLKKDGSGAVKSYQNALSLDPKNAEANYRIAKVYLTQGRDQESMYMQFFNNALNNDPQYAPALYDMYVYYFFRDVNKSKEYFNRYKEVADKGPALDYEEASLYFASSDFKEAINKANALLQKYGQNSDARFYRLRSYSEYKLGDSANALRDIETFFKMANEEQILPENWLTAAEIASKFPAKESEFNLYISKAIETDTTAKGKLDIVKKTIDIFKKAGNQKKVAEWALNVLNLPGLTGSGPGKVDIYNAGFENFKAGNYLVADSIFDIYKTRYPDEVYGHYWSFRSLSVIDSTMEQGLAIPDVTRFIELAENDKVKNKSTLITAYGYLAGYNANIKKDFATAITFLDKIIEVDPGNLDAVKNREIIQKAMDSNKKGAAPPKQPAKTGGSQP